MIASGRPDAEHPADANREALTAGDPGALAREVNHLHRLWFGRDPSPAFVDAYLGAHAALPELKDAGPAEGRTVERIVRHRLDALGIEAWLRRAKPRHLLTRKLLLIAYLAECDAGHPEFTPPATGRAAAVVALGLAGLRAGARLVRGRIQMALHGLV